MFGSLSLLVPVLLVWMWSFFWLGGWTVCLALETLTDSLWARRELWSGENFSTIQCQAAASPWARRVSSANA